MKKYNVVVIGCGVMAEEYLKMLTDLPQMKVVGVADRKPKRAKEYADKFGAESHTTDYRDLIKRKDVDVVLITTRPTSHAMIAIDSLRAGKDVFSEKPMAASLQEAQEIIKTVKETKRKMHVGFILRSHKTHQKLAEMIQKGAIGSPIVMRMLGGEHCDDEAWQWNLRILKDTSPLIDCGSHYVDVMRWVSSSEAVSICGTGARTEADVPNDNYNYEVVSIHFQDGSVGLYEAGWGHTMREFWEKEFVGPKGRLRLTYAADRPGNDQGKGDLIEHYSYPEEKCQEINVKCRWLEFDTEFLKLIRLIEQDGGPIPGLTDAIRSLEIVLAGHKATLTNKVVTISPYNVS